MPARGRGGRLGVILAVARSPAWPARLGAVASAFLLPVLGGCRPVTYDIDRVADPVGKARFSCQYLLERALAREDQKDADGVLRRRVADFADPRVTREGDLVRIVWPEGAIVLRATGSAHSGDCVMRLRPQGRHVDAVTLDGRPLHAGFGM